MRSRLQHFSLFFVLGLVLSSSGSGQEPVSFLNLVTVGDSLAAGFQNGVLNATGQVNAFPTLIAQRVSNRPLHSPWVPC